MTETEEFVDRICKFLIEADKITKFIDREVHPTINTMDNFLFAKSIYEVCFDMRSIDSSFWKDNNLDIPTIGVHLKEIMESFENRPSYHIKVSAFHPVVRLIVPLFVLRG